VCTSYGLCYEEHYDKDFRGGGVCVSRCEEMSAAEQREWADKINTASSSQKCASLFD